MKQCLDHNRGKYENTSEYLKLHRVLKSNEILAGPYLAVSSSPRPWIDIFALPEKSNMAVTESDPKPKVRKKSISFEWLCDLWAEHLGIELKCYWL